MLYEHNCQYSEHHPRRSEVCHWRHYIEQGLHYLRNIQQVSHVLSVPMSWWKVAYKRMTLWISAPCNSNHSNQIVNTHYNINLSTSSPTCWFDIRAVGTRSGIGLPATFLSHWRQFIGLADQTHTIEVVPPESFLVDPDNEAICIEAKNLTECMITFTWNTICALWNLLLPTKLTPSPARSVPLLVANNQFVVRDHNLKYETGKQPFGVSSRIFGLFWEYKTDISESWPL